MNLFLITTNNNNKHQSIILITATICLYLLNDKVNGQLGGGSLGGGGGGLGGLGGGGGGSLGGLGGGGGGSLGGLGGGGGGLGGLGGGGGGLGGLGGGGGGLGGLGGGGGGLGGLGGLGGGGSGLGGLGGGSLGGNSLLNSYPFNLNSILLKYGFGQVVTKFHCFLTDLDNDLSGLFAGVANSGSDYPYAIRDDIGELLGDLNTTLDYHSSLVHSSDDYGQRLDQVQLHLGKLIDFTNQVFDKLLDDKPRLGIPLYNGTQISQILKWTSDQLGTFITAEHEPRFQQVLGQLFSTIDNAMHWANQRHQIQSLWSGLSSLAEHQALLDFMTKWNQEFGSIIGALQ
ncbi:keratin, type I cytoskeletal 9-like [Oppia nitens]|uniref:keratin, type I cytoskeletal 9-like n=1 Tax=Oppia nitens TaxID=1686743 RepID=UPI0023DB6149|nr:keratin, type I cytoskeletal 9-like [Oppia nitens]